MEFHYKAFAFKSAQKLPAIKTKLNATGPWQWHDRESDRYAEYLSSFIPPDSMLKLYELEPGQFQLDVKLRLETDAADAKTQANEIFTRVEKTLLPAIGATGVADAEPED